MNDTTPTQVTVYNGGFALVKEPRQVNLPEGTSELPIEGVAAQIEPTSVGISLLSGDDLTVLEQNYRFDLISPEALLSRAIGQQVRLRRYFADGSTQVITGTLLSGPDQHGNSRGIVIQTEDGLILNPQGEMEIDGVPEGMMSRPTLVWCVRAEVPGERQLELSYLTQGMSWEADYVVTLQDDALADLNAWVTLRNTCGKDFVDSRLKLIAGDVNRARQQGVMTDDRMMVRSAQAEYGFQEEAMFEYHLYTLERPATLKNLETKQIGLMESHGVPYQKKLVIDASRHYSGPPLEGQIGQQNLNALARIEVRNAKDAGLGIPLPAGNLKMFQRDSSGALQLLGEVRIKHTAREELLSLDIGRSFDVLAERTRTNYIRHSKNRVGETFRILLKNRKEKPETVHVYERFYGHWEVKGASSEWTKLDAFTVQFVVELGAGEEKAITYGVETSW